MDFYYHRDIPGFLAELSQAPSVQRLRDVGMNCGCEYTGFPRFRGQGSYSRFRHSLGCALIVWHFTERPEEAAAALLHDIATPVFSHTVDFLYGDYMKQESTEEGTERIIRQDAVLCGILTRYGIPVDAVTDYHRYPIADNDSPRLSADRLEYTLGNAENYGIAGRARCREWYGDLYAGRAGGSPELCFRSERLAESFSLAALQCSRIYVSDEDRYSMQILSEILKRAIERNVIAKEDLYGTEPRVISLLQGDAESRKDWDRYCGMKTMLYGETAPMELRRVIPAKKRWIDPAVGGSRVSALSERFRTAKEAFLAESQTGWICAV